jgi:hypothetical protein
VAATAPTLAVPIVFEADQPDRDRWNYPFNFTPGTRPTASIFRVPDQAGFDDRDAQFVVGWNTAPTIPAGRPLADYRITAARITAVIASGGLFAYDPTFDSFRTLLPASDPALTPDADAGKPIELFGVGYRSGFSATNWLETSPFGGTPVVLPAQGSRNVFPALFDALGNATDVSNNLKDRFEAAPAAIGLTDDAAPGQLVPQDALFTFTLDLTQPSTVEFLKRGLQLGTINFAITGMHATDGGPGGGSGSPNYPVFYTRDDIGAQLFALMPTIRIEVQVGNPADLTGDGQVDSGDLALFITLFLANDLGADLTGDTQVDSGDLALFIQLFLAASGG